MLLPARAAVNHIPKIRHKSRDYASSGFHRVASGHPAGALLPLAVSTCAGIARASRAFSVG
ncbi:MAG: hypothetical protein OJF49_001256 [Ktedonobacterales bacterium]|nr:MAG: hypothetical protein OJF49_001256 [Ktedonobacterales bacterium]